MIKRPLYQAIASKLVAMANCLSSGNMDWYEKHKDAIESMAREQLPSGSGFDSGTTLDFDRSNGERLVFVTSFHHMNEAGMYDGWTDHNVTCTASLSNGYTLKVSGRNRNDIKTYICDTFSVALSAQEVAHAPSV